jgi:hypothetical protein
LGYAPPRPFTNVPKTIKKATTRGTAHHLIRNENPETRPILHPRCRKTSFRMSTEWLRGWQRGNERDDLTDIFCVAPLQCQPNPRPTWPALLPCLLAVMKCETTTPPKTHLDLHHTQHHPSHPTLASGPVSHRSGSIDGPSFFSSSLLEPSSQSLASTTILLPLDVKPTPHAPGSKRKAAPWLPCLIICLQA